MFRRRSAMFSGRSAAISSLCSVALFANCLAAAAETRNDGAQVVAEVNGTKITGEQLDLEFRRQLQQEGRNFSETEEHLLHRKLLYLLIERQLLIQAAHQKGLLPDDAEVEAFIQNAQRSFPSPDEFDSALETRGIDRAGFRQGVAEDLAVRAYVEKEVFSGLSATEEQMRTLYKASPHLFTAPEEVRARHILLRVERDADRGRDAEIKAQAESIAQQAREGSADFSFFAKKYSEAPNSAQGGDLGFFSRNQLDPAFSDAAFRLDPGAVSSPVRTGLGYHIIKVEQRRGGAVVPFADVKARLELEVLTEQKQRALREHLKKLRRESRVIVYYN